MLDVVAVIPWLLMVAFWIFVIWAVLALIGILKEIRSVLQGIRDHLGTISGRNTAGGP